MGQTAADWENPDVDTLTYFDVEPLTGIMMDVHKRLQYNFELDFARLDSFYGRKLFGNGFGGADQKIIFPIMWLDDYGGITEQQGSDFVDLVYAPREQFATLSAVLIAVGAVLLVLAAVLGFLGFKSTDRQQL